MDGSANLGTQYVVLAFVVLTSCSIFFGQLFDLFLITYNTARKCIES